MIEEKLKENEKLVYSIANLYKNYASKEDLYQAGFLGLMYAYKNFKSDIGTKFSTFAYPYILGEISKCVRKDSKINISKNIYSISHKIENAKSFLAQEYGRYPTYLEIIDYLKITEEEYILAIKSMDSVMSLDFAFASGDSIYEVVPDSINIEDMVSLKLVLEEIDPIDREIVVSHYLYDLTQMEISKNIGINQVAVSRREGKILKYLKGRV